jgi:hypothetical protein
MAALARRLGRFEAPMLVMGGIVVLILGAWVLGGLSEGLGLVYDSSTSRTFRRSPSIVKGFSTNAVPDSRTP